MNKKTIGIIGIVLLIVLLVVCLFINPDKSSVKLSNDPNKIYENAQKQSEKVKDNEKKDFIEIGVEKYLEYYNESEEKIVWFGHPSCEYCQVAAPIIQNIAYKYDLDIYYLNIANFTSEDADTLENSNSFFNDAGTPSLLIVGNGKLKDTIVGITDYDHYISILKKNRFIK